MKSSSQDQQEQQVIDRILAKFREDNPFASSASPLPWKNHDPDVPSLNRDAGEEISQLIRQKRNNPWSPLAGLVFGEAGVGKTHMLMRILRRMNERGQIALFVAVRAFSEPKTVFWDLLQEIGVSLESKRQSRVLMEEMKRAYKDCCEEDGFDPQRPMDIKTIQRQIRQRQMYRIDDEDVLRFILAYDKATDDEDRSDLILWLTGAADEDFARKHDLPERNFDALEMPDREERVRRTLLSFGHVLEYAKIPMVVCFDQLDMMDETLINVWGACVNLLINDMPNVLPLAFLRVDTWTDPFVKVLDRSVRERFQHKIVMGNCNLDQAHELIRQRIGNSPAFKTTPEDVEITSQWLIGTLEKKFSLEDCPPRIVIDLANRVIRDALSDRQNQELTDWEEICKVFEDELRKEIQKAADSPEDWPPSERWLFDALNVWKISQPEFELQTVNETQNKYIRFMGSLTDKASQKSTDCAFIFITSKTHTRALAGANRGVKFLREHSGGRCWYITDGRTHKGANNWHKVGESITEFENLGGTVLILNSDERANWYGFLAFVNKVRNGDVTLYPTKGNPRSANDKDLERWLREACKLDLLCGTATVIVPDSDDPEPQPSIDQEAKEQVMLDTLDSFFSKTGIHILDAKKAIAKFKKKGVTISLEELLSLVTRHGDRFDWKGTETNPIILKVPGAAK